jgi:3-hydroxyisobutyrate dehydrogenase-like beta-hydroxyacid dehydrogenase
MKVAFLGTGAMGSGISDNILKKGFDLTVWNIKDEFWANAEALAAKGAHLAESPGDAVKDADVIGMSLTADKIVELVCGQIYDSVKKGAVIFDCSTASPACAKKMYAKFAPKGVAFIDAPVSGGVAGAEKGTLTVMAGGDAAAVAKAEPVIKAFAGYFAHMGGIGAGQSTKLINQLLTGVNQAAVCEAMLIAEKAGLDLSQLYDLLVTAWGNSKMLERSVKEYIIPKKYESAACLQLMLKDLGLTIQMAHDVGYAAPLTELAETYYHTAADRGWGKQDHAAIIKIMEEKNKK